jgi:cell division protein FtsQ
VRSIEVDGASPAVGAEVRRLLVRELGRSLLAVSPDEAARRVEALPDVVSAAGDRDFPHTLRLVVRAERPVAVLRRGQETWLVSARGRVIRRVPRGTLRALPRVWLPASAGLAVGDILSDDSGGVAARAIADLQETPLRGVRGAVLSPRTGLVFVLRSGVELRLGAPRRIALKLAIAERIVPLLPSDAAVLDLSVPERPVSDRNSQPGG